MNPIPTGRLIATDAGRDLVLTRTFSADIDDVWASITESDRTARWFASWTGEAGPGRTITYRLAFEAGEPEPEPELTRSTTVLAGTDEALGSSSPARTRERAAI